MFIEFFWHQFVISQVRMAICRHFILATSVQGYIWRLSRVNLTLFDCRDFWRASRSVSRKYMGGERAWRKHILFNEHFQSFFHQANFFLPSQYLLPRIASSLLWYFIIKCRLYHTTTMHTTLLTLNPFFQYFIKFQVHFTLMGIFTLYG